MTQNALSDAPSYAVPIHVETGQLWPTPTLTVRIENAETLNARLESIILEQEAKIRAGAAPTSVAGISEGLTAYWQKFNVLRWDYPEVRQFREIVLSGLRQWISITNNPDSPEFEVAGISCWANVLRFGERLTIHHHDPAYLSAHYTVRSGFENNTDPTLLDSGYTVYYRPGFADRSHGGEASMAASPWDDDWAIGRPATPGRLFYFPSFVRHEVRPYLGHAQRISIAMDVFLKRQRLPIHFGGARWFVPGKDRQ